MGFIFLGMIVLAFVLLRFTVFGEYVYATGGNFLAAGLSGVPTRAIITFVFSVSGAMAAFGGVILTSRLRIAQPTVAQSLELDAIAAVVLVELAFFGDAAESPAPSSR
jgi:ribose transport system permease protein